ncbi:MAG: CHASE2 domain-containing protein [Draconibacterium sp.]
MDKSLINDLIFINTSYDNALVDNYDKKHTRLGNVPVTNREHLIQFLGYLKTHPNQKYVLCDVFFEHKSIHDSLLEQVLRQPNLVIPYRKDSGDSVFNSDSINYGEARIYLYNDTFFKYKLFNSKKKVNSIPLKMYEDLYKANIERGILWSKINGSIVLNDFIPKFYITNYELENLEINANIHYLQDVVTYPGFIIDDMVKDKIVVIADLFENDKFPTIVGKMPGALIMLNVYFSLVNMENKIGLAFMVYLFLILWFVSYLVFYPQQELEEILKKIPFLGKLYLL